MKKQKKRSVRTVCLLFVFVFLMSAAVIGIKIKAAVGDIDGMDYSAIGSTLSAMFSKKPKWNLIVVKKDNPLPSSFKVTLINFDGTYQVDKRINDDLKAMFSDAEKDGLKMQINSAYRSREDQQNILDEKIDALLAKGYSKKAAEKTALKTVALPGTSEHETGLAVDIGNCDGTDWSDTYSWLSENSYKYGFIMRYPEGKEDVTGIDYEIWHYRYVGKEAAKEIFDSGVCLEEYTAK